MKPSAVAERPSALIVPLWLGLVVISTVATWLAWPEWWTWIAPEASLAREINTGMLLATSALASLAWWRGRHGRERSSDRRRPGDRHIMALLAFGFLVLAADERVAIHERLRDRVLAPRNVTLPFIPWGEPGDIVLVVVAIAGLLVLPSVLRVVGADAGAQRWFVAGVILAVTSVALDTLPIETYQLRNEIYFQSGEEAIELAAAACFLSALLRLVDEPDPGAVEAGHRSGTEGRPRSEHQKGHAPT